MSKWILPALVVAAVSATAGCVDLTPCQRGVEGCACIPDPDDDHKPGHCNPVADGTAVCAAERCFVQRTYEDPFVCFDACAYRGDGFCDDGGPGSGADVYCGRGSDCTDCGARPNPCAATPATPRFCPQTPDNCWPTNTDCLTVRRCTAADPTKPYGCALGQEVDCNAVDGPHCVTANACTSPDAAILRRCISEGGACVGPYIDCESLTSCSGTTVGCYAGETVVCRVPANTSGCMP